jgi:hypothetical protein
MQNWPGEDLKPTRDSFWAYIFYRLCSIAALRARALGVSEVAMTSKIELSNGDDTVPLTVTVTKASELSGLGLTSIWAFLKDHRLEAVRLPGVRRTLVSYRSLAKLLAPSAEATPRRGSGRPRKIAQSKRAHAT